MGVLNTASLVLAVSVFLAALFAGLASPLPIESIEEQVSTIVGPVVSSGDPASVLAGLLSVILYNNVGVAVRCVTLGFTLAFPLYVLYANGYMLGSVVSHAGYGSLALVPHGVFELPAILYSSYLGVRIGVLTLVSLLLRLAGGRSTHSLYREYWEALRRLGFALLFLTLAALLEVFVSLPLGRMLR